MKRALRRHHRKRIINKYQRIYKNWGYENWKENGLYTASRGSIRCGCCMCANPRSRRSYEYKEVSIQERRAFQYEWEKEHGGLPE